MTYYPTIWRGSRAPWAWSDAFGARREFDRLFDRFFFGQDAEARSLASWTPVVDVKEDEDAIRVSTELPGLTAEDVKVTVENGVLSISGEKKQEAEEGEKGSSYYLVERQYGKFERCFTLPRSVDADKVKAKFENGVLNVDLPKSAKAKPKQIQVN